jgi:hypothetical protein
MGILIRADREPIPRYNDDDCDDALYSCESVLQETPEEVCRSGAINGGTPVFRVRTESGSDRIPGSTGERKMMAGR